MVFGVPLDVTLRERGGEAIPAAFYKCVKAVETRGLEREGIYRVSGKHTDVVELKQLLERDVGQVNLLEERWDLHVIGATVKLYLRTLPIPLFPFPPKERVEHSQIQSEQERILRLRTRIKALTRSHQSVLKFLVEHLALITSHSAKNKMSVQNIALIFSSFIFQPQPESEAQPKEKLPFWKMDNEKEKEPKQDLSQFEFMKQDGVSMGVGTEEYRGGSLICKAFFQVLEDLINHHERIFASEPPRPVMQEPAHPNSTPIPLRVDSLPDRVRTLGRPPSSPSPVPFEHAGKHLSAGMVGMGAGTSPEPPRSPRLVGGMRDGTGGRVPVSPGAGIGGMAGVRMEMGGGGSAEGIKLVPPLAVVNPDLVVEDELGRKAPEGKDGGGIDTPSRGEKGDIARDPRAESTPATSSRPQASPPISPASDPPAYSPS
ncbi:hypothetical protein HK097_003918 [Rhizophlyctis rosea]|uniref:Rho-GAP domain-containing protein n=1 Tax=Rhizophlyctis rosea TaxID=64517 RepID=A0AAD5X2W6_9FUNG|nr:hypothetical protein HK097_003918 [Rhizophlyctis rosea]